MESENFDLLTLLRGLRDGTVYYHVDDADSDTMDEGDNDMTNADAFFSTEPARKAG